MKVIRLLLICFMISGCATVTEVYFKDDIEMNKDKIDFANSKPCAIVKQGSPGMVKFENKDGDKIEVDTRQLNFFQSNVMPIFKSGYNKSEIK